MSEKGKDSFLDVLADKFDLPGEAVAGDSRVTITGNRRILIENHKGLMEYGENQIEVNCGKTILKIRGEELFIRAMNSQELLITGTIFGIDYIY